MSSFSNGLNRLPILLVRHSERVDEVISSEDYAQYTEKKRSQGRASSSSDKEQCGTLEVTYDPTIAHHVRTAVTKTGNDDGSAAMNTDDACKAALPYPNFYPGYRSNRCSISCQCDPPITRQGISIAKQAGRTAKAMIEHHLQQQIHTAPSSSSQKPLIRIYCSRLQRCIQTAYVIAKKLTDIDTLYVSSGLALTSNAVVAIGLTHFDFLTFDEIIDLCHDMRVIDCDTGTIYYGKNYHRDWNISNDNDSNNEQDVLVSCSSWMKAFEDIAKHQCRVSTSIDTEQQGNGKDCYKIIVIHRESIRNLMPKRDRLRLPYCCIAYCEKPISIQTNESRYGNQSHPFNMHGLYSPNGDRLRIFVDYDHIRPNGNVCRL